MFIIRLSLYAPTGEAWDPVSFSTSINVGSTGFGNGMYIMAGGEIWTSSDAANWRKVANTRDLVGGSVGYRVDAAGVAYGNGVFVAVGLISGTEDIVLYSRDGQNWATSHLQGFYGLRDVAFGNGVFRATGSSGKILESQDGAHWSEVLDLGAEAFGVGFGNGMFIYGGSGIYDDTGLKAAGGTNIWDIAFGKGIFVAVGKGGAIYQSSAVAADLPVPSGQSIYTLTPQGVPFLGDTADTTVPLSLGDFGQGGDFMEIQVVLNRYQAPVDVYLGFDAPDLAPGKIFLVTPVGSIIEFTGGLVPWKANHQGIIDERPFGAFPASALPQGRYDLYLLVTPARDLELSNYVLYALPFSVQ